MGQSSQINGVMESYPKAPKDKSLISPVVAGFGLSKRFGATQALREVSIQVQAGEAHALVGRNGAGKSTLVSILTGLTAPDTGKLTFSGEPAPLLREREAWQSRVACVYQQPKIVPALSSTENLFLNRIARSRTPISWKKLRSEAIETFRYWGLCIDPNIPAGRLSIGDRQLLEIARAVSLGSRFIILDEPTAKLGGPEIKRLFEQIEVLRSRGTSLLYISHYLEEIFSICDTVTVLRDGQLITSRPVKGLTKPELVNAMVGHRRITVTKPAPTRVTQGERDPTETVLAIEKLNCAGRLSNISLVAQKGECLGIGGLAASGKQELGEIIAGLRAATSGRILMHGLELPKGDVAQHIRRGVGLVPQDRHSEGLVLGMSVSENITMAVTDLLGRSGFIDPKRRDQLAGRFINQLDIKTTGPGQTVSGLSGGNQQKVVMGRALARQPTLLVLFNPTSGVDIASKLALVDAIRRLTVAGTTVLIVSDELDELELCDRVLVIFAGRITHEFSYPWTSKELVSAMEGFS
jgi:simple sugar transport system ATP-binding protein